MTVVTAAPLPGSRFPSFCGDVRRGQVMTSLLHLLDAIYPPIGMRLLLTSLYCDTRCRINANENSGCNYMEHNKLHWNIVRAGHMKLGWFLDKNLPCAQHLHVAFLPISFLPLNLSPSRKNNRLEMVLMDLDMLTSNRCIKKLPWKSTKKVNYNELGQLQRIKKIYSNMQPSLTI